jgi:hypothetical protein
MSNEKKVVLGYFFDGIPYEKELSIGNNLHVFVNGDVDVCLITDGSYNILLTITAGCGQNMGYLIINDK